jgi:predicted nucleic acid-binding protein
LRAAWLSCTLAVCPIVYTELFAHRGADRVRIEAFLSELRIEMVNVTSAMWSLAGERYARMAERRRQTRGDLPRRVAADFVIGAHAVLLSNALLTSDTSIYERNFSELTLL